MSGNLAEHYLENHEWGLAKLTIEEALEKGGILDQDRVLQLLREACHRMGVKVELEN